ncbi:MAG: sugar phosphate isomerase/epimerase family protein [Chitinophagaceae bacterium]
MKKLFKFPLLMLGLFLSTSSVRTAQAQNTPEKLGWDIGIQSYSFRNVSFLQSVDKVKSLGLRYIEAFPGQMIGGGMTGTMDYHMSAADREKILHYLRMKGVKLMSYGVVNPETDADWKKLFLFAKEMGLTNIVSEPHPSQIPLVSRLCDKYKINVAIHDHPRPSHYWNPDSVLEVLKGASPRIGSCADIGHWAYSDLNPVTCLKKLKGHIIELHMKDVANKEPASPEITQVWGKGIGKSAEVIRELYKLHFKGLISIEYEDDPATNITQIRESLKYFRNLVAHLK